VTVVDDLASDPASSDPASSDPASSAPASRPPAVRTVGLTKRYGSLLAVNDVHLEVPTGSIFGLIGPNGAGKSTTFAMVASLLTPTSGTLEVMGIDPGADRSGLRRRMGYMPDTLGVYDNLRVSEYLEFFAASYRVPRRQWSRLIGDLLELVELTMKKDSMVNSLSRGMKQRLSLARSLVHDPDLLVLDEPASGLDPRARVELRDLLRGLNAMGKTIIISSHILAELEEVCSHVAIMEAGRLLASGPPRQILDQLGGSRTLRVRFADGTTETYVVASSDDQVALLRRLVLGEDRQVVEFVEESGGLEQLFLTVTQGVVQ